MSDPIDADRIDARRKIAVIVLRPKRNRLPEILSLLPQLLVAFESCAAGAFFEVTAVESKRAEWVPSPSV